MELLVHLYWSQFQDEDDDDGDGHDGHDDRDDRGARGHEVVRDDDVLMAFCLIFYSIEIKFLV